MTRAWRSYGAPILAAFAIWFVHFVLCWAVAEVWPQGRLANRLAWGFTVAAESSGRVLVDATPFLIRDNLNLGPRLRPGTYRLDESRSSVYMTGTFNFPKNSELEVELTYAQQQQAGPPQGGAAREHAAGGHPRRHRSSTRSARPARCSRESVAFLA